jgi:hypothetical protein
MGSIPVSGSSTNKTDRHDITIILLKVALNTITLPHHVSSEMYSIEHSKWIREGQMCSLNSPVLFVNEIDNHYKTELLLKVALNTSNLN